MGYAACRVRMALSVLGVQSALRASGASPGRRDLAALPVHEGRGGSLVLSGLSVLPAQPVRRERRVSPTSLGLPARQEHRGLPAFLA